MPIFNPRVTFVSPTISVFRRSYITVHEPLLDPLRRIRGRNTKNVGLVGTVIGKGVVQQAHYCSCLMFWVFDDSYFPLSHSFCVHLSRSWIISKTVHTICGRGGNAKSCKSMIDRVAQNDARLTELFILPTKTFGGPEVTRLAQIIGMYNIV